MADVSNHYVNCEQLQKKITKINDIKVNKIILLMFYSLFYHLSL